MQCLPGARAIVAGMLAASLAQADNTVWPLPASETLHYSVEWRLINAGTAKITFQQNGPGANRGWNSNLLLESSGLVAKLYKVSDQYKANYEGDFCATDSFMQSEEGKRKRETTVRYDRSAGKASYLERDLLKNAIVKQSEVPIPSCIKDVLGGFYQLRRLNLQPGQSGVIHMSDGKKSADIRVEAQEWENITTKAGKYRALRYEAFLFNGALYERSAKAHIWVSGDEKRLPVQVKVRLNVAIGTITLQLEKEVRN